MSQETITQDYVTRRDGAQVATDNLDSEDLRFLAAEVRDDETAEKLRALARTRERRSLPLDQR
jgi:hypothetical protein